MAPYEQPVWTGDRVPRWPGRTVPAEDHVGAPAEGISARSPMLEIANAVVRIFKDAFGRGPTKARAQFAGPDVLVVILENSLTIAERNLVAMGEHARLRESRSIFQQALEAELRATVEQTLGRRTVAFVSGIDVEHDVCVEVFTLEAEPALDSNGRGPGEVRDAP